VGIARSGAGGGFFFRLRDHVTSTTSDARPGNTEPVGPYARSRRRRPALRGTGRAPAPCRTRVHLRGGASATGGRRRLLLFLSTPESQAATMESLELFGKTVLPEEVIDATAVRQELAPTRPAIERALALRPPRREPSLDPRFSSVGGADRAAPARLPTRPHRHPEWPPRSATPSGGRHPR